MKRCSEKRICEVCKTEYLAKVVEARFCSRKCMYQWRKNSNWETVNCIGCGVEFSRRKKERHHRTGLPTQYCSNKCSLSSPQKREKLKKWGLSEKNHWFRPEIQAKVKNTKKDRYGDENYNNHQQNVKTMLMKYGVAYGWWTNKANGKRISKPQIKLFEQVVMKHKDATLEQWLSDAQKSVDIYIPSEKKIIELYGTYWHCDPRKYKSDFYNKAVKMTAGEIWVRDLKRKEFLESLGYTVEIMWESDIIG